MGNEHSKSGKVIPPISKIIVPNELKVGDHIYRRLFTKWIFDKFEVFDGKSHKEKVYIEYGLNKNSCMKELRAVQRKVRREIRKGKLHPDQWPSDLNDKERPNRLEKYFWLTAIIEMLDEDI
eukprot:120135_1